MTVPDELAVPLSQRKLAAKGLGSLVFVIVGAWLFSDSNLAISAHRSPVFVAGIGLLCMAFFGLVAAFAFIKLYDARPGIVFTASGITDNSSGIAAGFIPWSDIRGFKTLKIRRTRFLLLAVRRPEKYLDAGNLLQQWLKHQNATRFGSPVALSSGALAIDFDQLAQLFEQYLAKYGNRAP